MATTRHSYADETLMERRTDQLTDQATVAEVTQSQLQETDDEKSFKGSSSLASLGEVQTVQPLAAQDAPTPRLIDIFRRRGRTFDLDAVATQPSVYDDPQQAKYSQPHPQWENNHRFDPNFRWTWREEKALIRKLDLRIALWAFIMFFSLDLDRENIAQANADDMLKDLGIPDKDYNLGQTLFRVAFLCAELPSQMISKKVGADRWIPAQLILWSIVSASQFGMKGRSSFLAFRWLIGMLQGGFIPDTVLWLSYFYTKKELPLRLAFFWVSNYLVKIVSPFLALGLLRLRGTGGHAGWQYLFLLEGLITLIVGLFSIVNMPAGPTQTKNWFYKKGWFSEREEYIMVNRIIRDDPSKADMHNRQGIDFAGFKKTLWDYDLWPFYALGLTFLIPSYPLSQYLTLQLKRLGFSTSLTNALSIPAPALGLVLLLAVTTLTEVVNNRSFVCMLEDLWSAPCYLALFLLPKSAGHWSYWSIASLQQAAPYVHPAQVAWVARNSGSVRARTISAALYNMCVQISSIIGANVYQPSDKPYYRKGNLAMAILGVAVCGQYLFIYFYYKWRNASRERKWSAMTKEEQIQYLEVHRDDGNKRLDFRFAT
ncbi:unnamed protein product [Parajaminaea phylloscopi]